MIPDPTDPSSKAAALDYVTPHPDLLPRGWVRIHWDPETGFPTRSLPPYVCVHCLETATTSSRVAGPRYCKALHIPLCASCKSYWDRRNWRFEFCLLCFLATSWTILFVTIGLHRGRWLFEALPFACMAFPAVFPVMLVYQRFLGGPVQIWWMAFNNQLSIRFRNASYASLYLRN